MRNWNKTKNLNNFSEGGGGGCVRFCNRYCIRIIIFKKPFQMWMKLLHLGGLNLSREEVSPELRLVLLQQVLEEGAEAEDGLRVGGHLQFVI